MLPANKEYLYSICTTTAQRLRRWSNVVQMLYSFVFAGRGPSPHPDPHGFLSYGWVGVPHHLSVLWVSLQQDVPAMAQVRSAVTCANTAHNHDDHAHPTCSDIHDSVI